MRLFSVLVADPPWPSQPTSGRWAPKGGAGGYSGEKYKLLSEREISEFRLPPLSDHAVLFLWRLSSMQEMALRVCRAWGFRPYGELVWNKQTLRGNKHCGMGLLIRGSHETCLVGVRKLLKPRATLRSTFEAPTLGHSQKPELFFDLVEATFVGPYAELFARRKRKGWTCYGDEL